jgi:MFS family permease
VRQVSGFPPGYWWLWTSTLVNRLGTFVVPFLTIYLTTQRGYSAAHAGLVVAIYGIGASLGALLGGELTDRAGRRATMAGAQLAAALTAAVFGLVTGPIAIVVLAFLFGVSSSASRPAVAAMIADIVEPGDRVRAYAINYWAINIGFAVSAAIAGFVAREGYVWLFIGDAVTTFVCAVVMWFKLPETHSRPRGGPVEAASVGPVLRDGRFLLLCLLGFAMWMIFHQGSSSLPVAMSRNGISPVAYGLVIALNGLVIVVLQIPVTGALRGRGRAGVLALSALLTGVGFGMTGFAGTSIVLYAASVVVWTLGEMAYSPAVSASLAEMARGHTHGRYQGVYAFGTSMAAFLGPLAGGVVLDRWDGPALWLGCAALGLVAAAGFRWLRLSAVPSDAAALPGAPLPAAPLAGGDVALPGGQHAGDQLGHEDGGEDDQGDRPAARRGVHRADADRADAGQEVTEALGHGGQVGGVP